MDNKKRVINNIKRELERKRPTSTDQTEYEDINREKSTAEKYEEKVKDFLSNFKRHKSPSGAPSRFSRIKPKYVLIILLIICAALIAGSAYAPQAFQPLGVIASVLVTPAQKGVNSVGLWFSDRIKLAGEIEKLSAEKKELEKELANMKAANTALRNQSAELFRLQDLMKMNELYSEYDSIGASIISMDSGKWFSTFTINRGSRDGIKKDMNVIANGGLCGIVTDTGYNYSVVRAIIDDDSAVSAQFQESSELCIVHGKLTLQEKNLLEFTDVPLDVEIKEGQAVTTSRVSSKFLPGLLIGYVSEYITDANELTKSGYITPAVDFSNLSEVLVLTTLKQDYIIDDDTEEDDADQPEEAATEKASPRTEETVNEGNEDQTEENTAEG